MNVCTVCYSMIWWDWSRWQREIDWMALHGINMPLAMTGQEAIWQKVWHNYGLSDEQMDDALTKKIKTLRLPGRREQAMGLLEIYRRQGLTAYRDNLRNASQGAGP